MGYKYKLKDGLNELKWKGQRFKRGYSDCDTWNIDNWFLTIMPKMLQDLKDNLHGHPVEMNQEEWENLLDKMIYCFKEANEDTCSKINEFNTDNLFDTASKEDGTISIIAKDEEIHQKWIAREHELAVYRDQKLYEGLDLFKENFRNLWD